MSEMNRLVFGDQQEAVISREFARFLAVTNGENEADMQMQLNRFTQKLRITSFTDWEC